MRRIAAVLLLLCACTAGRIDEARVRTALDVFGATVDPAYDASTSACESMERAVPAAIRAGKLTVNDGDRELATVRIRCDNVRAVFDAIRAAHDEAATLVEAGKLDEANEKLAQVRELWRSLGDER